MGTRREVKELLGDNTEKIAAGEISELVVVAEGEERTTWFVWLLAFCSSISGLLFGQPSFLFSPPRLIP